MSKRILVMEDDPASQRLTKYILEHNGYEVRTASNGLEGLRKVQEEEYDLIILDVMLPGIDGFEICYHLRTNPRTTKLPILMLSAKARDADKDTAFKVGVDDYITKPVSPAEILKKVENLLIQREHISPI